MKLLHDVENNKWYNENGDSFSSDNPAIPYGNSERVVIQLYAEVKGANSGSEAVEDWVKYTGFSGSGYGAILATDNNFLHWYKAQLSTVLSAGTIETGTVIEVATGVSAENISETGNICLYNADGDTESIAYSSRKAVSGGIRFTAAEGNVLEHSYAVNDQTDIPEMLYAEAAMLAEESDPANGLFVFDFICDSPKLRNKMQYSSVERVDDCKGLELTVFQTQANNTVSIRKRFRCNTFRITGGIADVKTGVSIRSHEENLIVALVNAMIASGLSIQFSSDGENWHDTQTDEDQYVRMRPAGNGVWSSAIRLPSGRPGENATTPHIDPTTKHWMIGDQDTEICAEGMPGTPGEGQDGKSAYELAVENGYEGTVEQWLADLKGADGNAVTPDATGVLEELPLYADRPAGFIFGATVISDEWTDVYYYAKKSDALGDWCTPMVIREYGHNGKDGKNIALLPPVEFVRDRDQQGNPIRHDYLHFSMEDYPGASIACVTIETDEGEYVLPYNSATGITKILKVENDYRIYFGAYVPDWERGKVYLAQGGVALDAVADAPEDGRLYARCNGHWVRISATEDPEVIPSAYFGTVDDGETYAVNQITEGKLASLSSLELTSDRTETLSVTPGSVTVILVPDGYAVFKDDGFGSKVPFERNNGTVGTGANGETVTIGGTEYKSYGEFNMTTGNTIIYIQQEI